MTNIFYFYDIHTIQEEEDSVPAHLKSSKQAVENLKAAAMEEVDDEQCFALLEF